MHLQKQLKGVSIETSTYLGSLQKFEGAAGEFIGALGSQQLLPPSPVKLKCNVPFNIIFSGRGIGEWTLKVFRLSLQMFPEAGLTSTLFV